jgi:hypothetical protein
VALPLHSGYAALLSHTLSRQACPRHVVRVELGSSEGTALVVPHTVSVELTRVYMGKREVFHTANFLTAKLHGISLHSFTMANPEVLTPLRLSRFYGTTVWK